MTTKNHQPVRTRAQVPRFVSEYFSLPKRLTSDSLLELLLVKCSRDTLDAKAAFLTIAAACQTLELSCGRKVRYPDDFREFFEEMANRLSEAPPIEKAPTPVKE